MRTRSLRSCSGYRVATRDCGVGRVAAVVPSKGDDEGGMLIVHWGPSCGLSVLPFDEVEGVDVQERRLVVREEERSSEKGDGDVQDDHLGNRRIGSG
jgi:hypothetical protein